MRRMGCIEGCIEGCMAGPNARCTSTRVGKETKTHSANAVRERSLWGLSFESESGAHFLNFTEQKPWHVAVEVSALYLRLTKGGQLRCWPCFSGDVLPGLSPGLPASSLGLPPWLAPRGIWGRQQASAGAQRQFEHRQAAVSRRIQ